MPSETMFRATPSKITNRIVSSIMSASPARAPRALVGIADGSEDLELATITDVLARAGVEVVTACAMPNAQQTTVKMARGLHITADGHIEQILAKSSPSDFDCCVFPGGMPGAAHLGECKPLIAAAEAMKAQGKVVGAICAAPVVALGPHGLLKGISTATCFPMMKEKMPAGTTWVADEVVVAHPADSPTATFVLSQGPATAMPFALQLAALLAGPETAAKVAHGLLVKDFKPVHAHKSHH